MMRMTEMIKSDFMTALFDYCTSRVMLKETFAICVKNFTRMGGIIIFTPLRCKQAWDFEEVQWHSTRKIMSLYNLLNIIVNIFSLTL